MFCSYRTRVQAVWTSFATLYTWIGPHARKVQDQNSSTRLDTWSRTMLLSCYTCTLFVHVSNINKRFKKNGICYLIKNVFLFRQVYKLCTCVSTLYTGVSTHIQHNYNIRTRVNPLPSVPHNYYCGITLARDSHTCTGKGFEIISTGSLFSVSIRASIGNREINFRCHFSNNRFLSWMIYSGTAPHGGIRELPVGIIVYMLQRHFNQDTGGGQQQHFTVYKQYTHNEKELDYTNLIWKLSCRNYTTIFSFVTIRLVLIIFHCSAIIPP